MNYYNEKTELMPENQLQNLQLTLLNKQLTQAKKTKAYKDILPKKINNLSEIENLPLTTKTDLLNRPLLDYCANSPEKIARYNSTSGSTGNPIIIYFSKDDLKHIAKRSARNLYMAGLRAGDVCQIIAPSNLHIGGWYFIDGCLDINAPFYQTGAGNTLRQIDFLKSLKPKFCFSTSGYFFHMLKTLSQKEIEEIALKGCVVGAEPTSDEVKFYIKEQFNIELYDVYGLTEVGGPFAQDCSYHNGLHVPEDNIYVEIIDPQTGKVLPDGELGELVVTPLHQEIMPLIRYRTGDLTRIITGKCPCGRTHRRIDYIKDRIDNMMIINGVNVFPSKIEKIIYKYLPVGTDYLIHVLENEGLKKILIDIEVSDDFINNKNYLEKLTSDLMLALKTGITVTPILNFVPAKTLNTSQLKMKRIVKEIKNI